MGWATLAAFTSALCNQLQLLAASTSLGVLVLLKHKTKVYVQGETLPTRLKIRFPSEFLAFKLFLQSGNDRIKLADWVTYLGFALIAPDLNSTS